MCVRNILVINKPLLTISAILALAACGTVPPRVQYSAPPSSAESAASSSGYLFRLRRSILHLELDKTASTTKAVKVTAVPSELDKEGKYMPLHQIQGVDDYRSTTALQVTYIPNTKFIDTIGIKTTDNVQTTIQSVSGLLQKAAPLAVAFGLLELEAGGSTTRENLAKAAIDNFQAAVIDPAIPADDWVLLPNNPTIWYKLATVSESAITADQFFSSATGGQRVLPVAACSTANLQLGFAPIKKGTSSPTFDNAKPDGAVDFGPSFQVTIADTANVTVLALPSSGSLKMHSICGADTTEDAKQDRNKLIDDLSVAMDEANKAITAWKNAKTPAKKPAS